jgi:6-phosphogluconolactonase (cycloisomerase 2 family)
MTFVKTSGSSAFVKSEASLAQARGSAQEFLCREEVLPSPVMFPRSFAIDPSGRWLIVAGQTGNGI